MKSHRAKWKSGNDVPVGARVGDPQQPGIADDGGRVQTRPAIERFCGSPSRAPRACVNAFTGRNLAQAPTPSLPQSGGEGRGEEALIKHGSNRLTKPLSPALSQRCAAGRGRDSLCGRQIAPAFTLIELVIALAISAVVLVAINTLFFGAMKLRARVTEAAEQNLPIDHAMTVMKQDLINIVPPGTLAGPMGTDATSVGMSQTPILEIYTASGSVSADAPWGDVQKIDYTLQTPTNRVNYAGRDLVRGVTRNLLAEVPPTPEPQTLLQNVQDLQFSYYDGTNWNNTWSTTLSNIPLAIKVMIDFPVEKGSSFTRPPIEFVVPVVAFSNTNSVTNLVSN